MRAGTLLSIMTGIAAFLLIGISVGCNDSDVFPFGDPGSPSVASTNPLDTDTTIALNRGITAIFNESMAPASFTTATFTLSQGGLHVAGTPSYVEEARTATFTPTGSLLPNTLYTATITTGVTDLTGIPLASNMVWTFTTGTTTDTTAPTVSSTNPVDTATGVVINGNITATFSEAMNPASITETSFSLRQGAAAVSGVVTFAGTVATFNPTANLTANTVCTATITVAVKDLAGNTMAVNKIWTFTTGIAAAAGPAPVNLGTAGNFVILTKSGISTIPNSAVTGDMGVSPIAQSAITGFSLIADASNTFATSVQDTGKIYAANNAAPTPAYMTTAVSDMEIAYTDAAGRTNPNFSELGAGQIGGMTLVPGLYKWGTGVLISTNVTLSGGPNDVWIFQIAGGLNQASATNVILTGGALPKNIFWQTFGVVEIGTTAHFEGIILSKTGINVRTNASANTRLLAQTAVTLQQNAITQPAP